MDPVVSLAYKLTGKLEYAASSMGRLLRAINHFGGSIPLIMPLWQKSTKRLWRKRKKDSICALWTALGKWLRVALLML